MSQYKTIKNYSNKILKHTDKSDTKNADTTINNKNTIILNMTIPNMQEVFIDDY